MSRKHRPTQPPERSYEDIMFNEAGCSNDCTGLIPSEVMTESEYESYEQIYDFGLPKSVKDDLKKK